MRNSAFGFDAPEHSPGFLLWQTTIMWQRLIKKALDLYEISHAQFVVLAVSLWFEEQGEMPNQSSIVRLSKLDKMTVSKALKKLVAQGLVKRAEHEEDTRAKSVQLSARGKALVAKLVPIVESIDAQFFGVLESKQHKSLVSALAQIVARINDENG